MSELLTNDRVSITLQPVILPNLATVQAAAVPIMFDIARVLILYKLFPETNGIGIRY